MQAYKQKTFDVNSPTDIHESCKAENKSTRELTATESYFLDESGDNYEHGSCWSEDHQDPTNYWQQNMCHVYYNRNATFKLKEEKWHGHTSLIIKPEHLDVLSNNTPFSDAKVKRALIEIWFGSLAPFDGNEYKRLMRNYKSRNKRAKLKGVNNGL